MSRPELSAEEAAKSYAKYYFMEMTPRIRPRLIRCWPGPLILLRH